MLIYVLFVIFMLFTTLNLFIESWHVVGVGAFIQYICNCSNYVRTKPMIIHQHITRSTNTRSTICSLHSCSINLLTDDLLLVGSDWQCCILSSLCSGGPWLPSFWYINFDPHCWLVASPWATFYEEDMDSKLTSRPGMDKGKSGQYCLADLFY